MLATQIKSALVAAHVPVIDRIGEMFGSTNPRVGVIITGPDDQLVSALLGTLKALSPAKAPYHEGFTMDGVGPVVAAPPAEIFVGIKPIIP